LRGAYPPLLAARESVHEISDDFDLEAGEVEQALRYEWDLSAVA
jgi:uncharacterized protein (DUF433 family)